jgi:hypothetical protein
MLHNPPMPQVYTRFPDEWNAALMARVYGGPLILPWWIQAGIFGFDGDIQLGSGASVIAARPGLDQTCDLGTSSRNFRDLWVGNNINKEAGTSGVYAKCGGLIYQSITDVTTPAGATTETDLWSQSIAANVLAVNNESLHFVYCGQFTGEAVNTDRLRVYMGGTAAGNIIFDSTAAAVVATQDWSVEGHITRASSTSARCRTVMTCGLINAVVPLFTYVKYFEITTASAVLNWDTEEILKITGQRSANGTQIAFRMGKIYYEPAV